MKLKHLSFFLVSVLVGVISCENEAACMTKNQSSAPSWATATKQQQQQNSKENSAADLPRYYIEL